MQLLRRENEGVAKDGIFTRLVISLLLFAFLSTNKFWYAGHNW